MNGDGWNPTHTTHKHGDGMGMLTMAAGVYRIMGFSNETLRFLSEN
jgi:hypothetical protein